MEPKKGQIWINKGFEVTYKNEFFHSVVRILEVNEDRAVLIKSLCDNPQADFDPNDEPFIRLMEDFKKIFRPKKPGDIDRLIKNRRTFRTLYGTVK